MNGTEVANSGTYMTRGRIKHTITLSDYNQMQYGIPTSSFVFTYKLRNMLSNEKQVNNSKNTILQGILQIQLSK